MSVKEKIPFRVWINYQNYVRGVVLPKGEDGLKNISYLRNEIFFNILIYLTPLSIIALIPGVYMAFLNGIPTVGLIDLTAFLLLIVLMVNRALTIRVRKLIFISLFYFLAVALIYYVGKAGAGLLYLLALTVLSSVIYSSSAGYYSAWTNTFICLAFGVLTYFDANITVIADYSFGTWIAVTSNLVLLSFGCAKCLDLLLGGLAIALNDKKKSKDKLKKSSRLYQFISHINRTIVHTKDERTLFRNSCKVAFDIGKFKMAWIGIFDAINNKIILSDQNGIPEQNIPLFSASCEKNGPQDHVLRTHSHYVCNDLESDLELESWKPFAMAHGVRSCIVLPIKREGVIIGSLNLYATELNFFDEEEIRLLNEATRDISFVLGVFENVKRHKITEDLIIRNENRFRSLIEKSTDVKMLSSLEGKFIYGSPSVTNQFGYSAEEFLCQSASTFFHPDDLLDLHRKRLAILEVPGKSFSFQYRLLHRNGFWIWCEGTFTNMLHEPGIHAFVSNFKDISERRLAEQKLVVISNDLRRSLNDFQKIMNSSLDIICSIDEEGKFVKISAASEVILGYKPEELSGKRYIDLVWHEDVESTSQMAVGIMSGKAVTFFENRYMHKNGSVVPIVWSATWDSNEKLMYCIAKDVTERKKIERQLNTSKTFNEGMLRDITLANKELIYQNHEKGKRAAELVLANEELLYQNKEKENRAAELILANKELIYQNGEKGKRAAELVLANEELLYQNDEKGKRAAELVVANEELLYQNEEKEKRAAELVIANKELIYQNDEKGKRAAELIIANKELIYQNNEKGKRAAELDVANKELLYQNKEKEKRAAELIIANKELVYQNDEREKRAAELVEANKQLVRAKKQKEFAKNNLKALINNTNDLMWSVDRELKIITSNEPFNEMIHFISGKSVSRRVNALSAGNYSPEKFKRYEGYYERAFSGESFTEIEPTGIPVESWSEISFHPILKVNEIIGTACHSRDITERKRKEEERNKMSADIIQRSKILEQFAYIVSHNLRSPVAHILGISNVLKGALSKADRIRSQEYLYIAVEKMDEVITDLNKILATKSEIMENKESVNFLQLVNDIKSGIENLLQREEVKIVTDFESINETKTLKGYLHSIFYNLITNSIKYRQNGKPPVIKIKSSIMEENIKISFKDNGTGLDLHQHGNNLFGLYKRFHANIEGKGVGLFMIKTQLEALGGRISVKSEPNEGAEFIIELPICS